ncbi:hypothetical protein [Ottowia thiooxydans]|uniref:Ankyrin repeat-containing protein n=1 Tax=Ottowia thiooxydans TaxID=219182 RepID=A0ABV2Q7L5_9BURK
MTTTLEAFNQVSHYFYPQAATPLSTAQTSGNDPAVSVGTGQQSRSLREEGNFVFAALYEFFQYFCPRQATEAATETPVNTWPHTGDSGPSPVAGAVVLNDEQKSLKAGETSPAEGSQAIDSEKLLGTSNGVKSFRSELALAAGRGDVESVKKLKAFLNTQSAMDHAQLDILIALNMAALCGQADCFTELLGLLPQGEIDRKDSDVQAALKKAAESGHTGCLTKLVSLMKPEAAVRFVGGELVGAAAGGHEELSKTYADLLSALQVTSDVSSLLLKFAMESALTVARTYGHAGPVEVPREANAAGAERR